MGQTSDKPTSNWMWDAMQACYVEQGSGIKSSLEALLAGKSKANIQMPERTSQYLQAQMAQQDAAADWQYQQALQNGLRQLGGGVQGYSSPFVTSGSTVPLSAPAPITHRESDDVQWLKRRVTEMLWRAEGFGFTLGKMRQA